MRIHHLIYSLIAVCFFNNVVAQDAYLQAAEKYYAAGDYYSAANYYEKYLSGKKTSREKIYNPYAIHASSIKTKSAPMVKLSRNGVVYRVAESYHKLNYHAKALPYFEEAKTFDKNLFPLAGYYYAATLQALSKNDEAAAAYNSFLEGYTNNDQYREIAVIALRNIQFASAQLGKNASAYSVTKLGTPVNSDGGSYAPLWSGNTLYFTSTRSMQSKEGHVNRLYQTAENNGSMGAVVDAAVPQAAGTEQGIAALSPDGKTMFITRWASLGTKEASIFRLKKLNDKWDEPVRVDNLNMAASNTQQPFVMPDGKHLLFSSDRPGGAGGFDIWYASLDEEGNIIGEVKNIGEAVNTKFDEQSPFYHGNSGTLVFSSNGYTGMGGFDLLYSRGQIGDLTGSIVFGHPVNSVKDDIYFTSRGSADNILADAIISSDRDAACCLELFNIKKSNPWKTVQGLVVACNTKKPLASADVIIKDAEGRIISKQKTGSDGRYTLQLDEYIPLNTGANATGYFANDIKLAPDGTNNFYNAPDLCLDPIPTKAITLNNIYYDFNKASIKEESFPSLDSLVNLLNENEGMLIELGSHTDSKGTDAYNLKLSDARAKTVMDYLIQKGIDPARLISKGYGETMPLVPNDNADGTDNPAGRQQNRRTEFRVIKE